MIAKRIVKDGCKRIIVFMQAVTDFKRIAQYILQSFNQGFYNVCKFSLKNYRYIFFHPKQNVVH